jgi:hypothetical protein
MVETIAEEETPRSVGPSERKTRSSTPESLDEPPSSPPRKRLQKVKNISPLTKTTQEEKQKLEDDLVDLAFSDPMLGRRSACQCL